MDLKELEAVARALVAPGRGILAADESTGTIKERLNAVGVESTEPNRRAYRELLFTTPGVEEHISGVILYDETIRQATPEGIPFPEYLTRKGILPGIKVDKGAVPLALLPGEKITEGLDGLRGRLEEYVKLGARFAKWRAVITIGDGTADGIPTLFCIQANAHALARYAALCQEANLVPIVEPEVLMTGSHTLERCADATLTTLKYVFSELLEHRVALEGMLLKPNMVVPGEKSPVQASVEDVARATIRVLRLAVPPAVPGIVFLSGGQGPELATRHLNAMNALGPHPWELSFSYGRALQEEALKAWKGEPANTETAQQAFFRRASMTGAARLGRYTEEMETTQQNP
jgi:fructose-bisphosphate aldolase class I